MRTPGADRELAAGFLFTEGIVTALADIVAVHVDPSGDVVDVVLTAGSVGGGRRAARRAPAGDDDLVVRHVRAPGSGVDAAHGAAGRAAPAPSTPTPSVRCRRGWRRGRRPSPRPAACTPPRCARATATIVDTAEDVGRHNAVDKIIGRQLLAERAAARRRAAVRQRPHVVRDPAEGLAGRRARSSPPCRRRRAWPSSWRTRPGITLIGFVRGGRFNIYTHAAPHRAASGDPWLTPARHPSAAARRTPRPRHRRQPRHRPRRGPGPRRGRRRRRDHVPRARGRRGRSPAPTSPSTAAAPCRSAPTCRSGSKSPRCWPSVRTELRRDRHPRQQRRRGASGADRSGGRGAVGRSHRHQPDLGVPDHAGRSSPGCGSGAGAG